MLGAIPVERSQDAARKGTGKVVGMMSIEHAESTQLIESQTVAEISSILKPNTSNRERYMILKGNQDCVFSRELKDGCAIRVKQTIPFLADSTSKEERLAIDRSTQIIVKKAIADNVALVSLSQGDEPSMWTEKGLSRVEGMYVIRRSSHSEPESQPMSPADVAFDIIPKMEQIKVYEQVLHALNTGHAITLFPEGGSHDRPTLLPLKPGVALFALQANAAGISDVIIIPVGLHYFNRMKLGSSAIVEIGKPIGISKQLADGYQQGGNSRRTAVKGLLSEVAEGLRSVIVCAESYKTLMSTLR